MSEMMTERPEAAAAAVVRLVLAGVAAVVAVAGALVALVVTALTVVVWIAVVEEGQTWRSPIDIALVVGVGVVAPMALGGRWWWWAGAAVALTLAVSIPAGEVGAVVFALPFPVVAGLVLVVSLRSSGPVWWWTGTEAALGLATLYALCAGGAAVASVAGLELAGIGEPIVELTAVHYLYAGAASLVLAARARDAAPERWRRVALAGLVATGLAPPVVALGFVTQTAVLQVGGALLMASGVCLTATQHLRDARDLRPVGLGSLALAISGLAVWVPMVLAVAWAAGQHWDVPALSIPDMARTHGMANAFAFVLCGLAGRWWATRPRRPRRHNEEAAV